MQPFGELRFANASSDQRTIWLLARMLWIHKSAVNIMLILNLSARPVKTKVWFLSRLLAGCGVPGQDQRLLAMESRESMEGNQTLWKLIPIVLCNKSTNQRWLGHLCRHNGRLSSCCPHRGTQVFSFENCNKEQKEMNKQPDWLYNWTLTREEINQQLDWLYTNDVCAYPVVQGGKTAKVYLTNICTINQTKTTTKNKKKKKTHKRIVCPYPVLQGGQAVKLNWI